MKNKKIINVLLALAISGGFGSVVGHTYADDSAKSLVRLQGNDRYETSVEVSKKKFTKSDTAIIVSGENFSDSVVGKELAEKYKAPILMIKGDSVPNATKDEMSRLGIKKVVIIGGENTIKSNVEKELSNSYSVNRVKGNNRHETSLKVAKEVNKGSLKSAIYVNGYSFSDSIVASNLSSVLNKPVILTDGEHLTEEDYKVANPKSPENVIVGGSSTMKVKGLRGNVISGKNRYMTSVEVAKKYFKGNKNVMLVTGNEFPDSLLAASLSLSDTMPILLSDKNGNNDVVYNYVKENKASKIFIIGGTDSVPKEIERKVSEAAGIKIKENNTQTEEKKEEEHKSTPTRSRRSSSHSTSAKVENNKAKVEEKVSTDSKAAGKTAPTGTTSQAGKTAPTGTTSQAGKTAANETTPQVGTTSANETTPQAGTTSANETTPQAGTTSANETTPQAGATSSNETTPQAGATSANETTPQAGATSSSTTTPTDGTTAPSNNGESAEANGVSENASVPNTQPMYADGVYEGIAQSIQYPSKGNNRVNVTVENGRIANVRITGYVDDEGVPNPKARRGTADREAVKLGFNEGWRATAEKILEKIVEYQDVDKLIDYIKQIDNISDQVDDFRNDSGRADEAQRLLGVTLSQQDREFLGERNNGIGYRNRVAKIFAENKGITPDTVSGATFSKRSLLEATKSALIKSKEKAKNIAASEFTEVAKNTNPELEYFIGGNLNLSKLRVNLLRADRTIKEVPYSDFAANNIEVYILRNGEKHKITEALKQGDKLEVIHNPSRTKLTYTLVITREINYLSVAKVKYKLDGDQNYREVNVENGQNSFVININVDEKILGKKIKELHLYDNEGNEIQNLKYKKDLKEVSFEDVNTVDGINKVLHLRIENTAEMEEANKDYRFKDIDLSLNSKSNIDLSSISWVELKKMPTNMEHGLVRRTKMDYSGMIVILHDTNEHETEVPFEDFDKYGMSMNPVNDEVPSIIFIKSGKKSFSPKLIINNPNGNPKEFTVYKKLKNDSYESMSIENKDKESVETHKYQDPVVYKVTQLKQSTSTEDAEALKAGGHKFKTEYNVGDHLNLKGLVIELLDEHGQHPDNDPQSYSNDAPDYKKNHENLYLLVPENDSNHNAHNLFKNNNIELNLQDGQVLTKNDTELVITYTNKEHDNAKAVLRIPLTINGTDSATIGEHSEPGNDQSEGSNTATVNYDDDDEEYTPPGMEESKPSGTQDGDEAEHQSGSESGTQQGGGDSQPSRTQGEEAGQPSGTQDGDEAEHQSGSESGTQQGGGDSQPSGTQGEEAGQPSGTQDGDEAEHQPGSESGTQQGGGDSQPAEDAQSQPNPNEPVKAVEVYVRPDKINYNEGDTLDLTGLQIILKDKDSSTYSIGEEYLFTKDNMNDYEIKPSIKNGAVLNGVGDKEIVFTYHGVKSKPVTIHVFSKGTQVINKKENPAKSIENIGKIAKDTYNVGDTIDLEGIYIRLKDRKGQYINLGSEWISIFKKDNFTKFGFKTNFDGRTVAAGDHEIVITFTGYGKAGEDIGKEEDLTISIPIKVNPASSASEVSHSTSEGPSSGAAAGGTANDSGSGSKASESADGNSSSGSQDDGSSAAAYYGDDDDD